MNQMAKKQENSKAKSSWITVSLDFVYTRGVAKLEKGWPYPTPTGFDPWEPQAPSPKVEHHVHLYIACITKK